MTYLLSHEVGQFLGIGADRVRALADAGKIQCIRTPSGTRLFTIGEVEREIKRRRARQDRRLRPLPRRTRAVGMAQP
jgi:predicted site-specific integrase-resolvase